MQTVLIVIHLLVVIALIATVLLQRSEGGALGMGGSSGGGFFTGRGQANALTRATAILATLFFITSLSLTILASYTRSQKSIFESGAAPAAPVSAPASAPDANGSFLGHVKQTVVDGVTQIEQKFESMTGAKPAAPAPAAPPADSTRAAPDASPAKGTVLDQLKQMEKNAPPSPPGSEPPPRAR